MMNVAFEYSTVDHFQYQFEKREKRYYMAMDQNAWPDRTIPLQSWWLMALSAMTVDCE